MRWLIHVWILCIPLSCFSVPMRQGVALADTVRSLQYVRLGEGYLGVGNYKKAIHEFKLAIKQDKKNWKAYRLKAAAEYQLDDYKASVADYSKALRINRWDTASYAGRAEARRLLGDVTALEDYNIALSWNPNLSAIRFGRALCFFYAKKYDSSIYDLNIYIPADAANHGQHYATAVQLRGTASFLNGQDSQAIRDITLYHKMTGKTDQFAKRGIAYLYLAGKGNHYVDSAIADLEIVLVEHPQSPNCLFYLGRAYIAKGEFTRAEEYLQLALAVEPGNVNILFGLITTTAHTREYQKGFDFLQKYMKLRKELKLGDEFYYSAIIRWGAKRDTLGAIQDFDKAAERGGVDPTSIFEQRFYLLFGVPKYSGAVKKYIDDEIEQAVDSTRLSSLFAARSLTNSQLGNVEGMRSDIMRAVGMRPQNSLVIMVKCALRHHLNLGDDEVRQDYDTAIHLNYKSGQLHLMKAYFDRECGDLTSSCESLAKARELGSEVTEGLKKYICLGLNLQNDKESELSTLYSILREAI